MSPPGSGLRRGGQSCTSRFKPGRQPVKITVQRYYAGMDAKGALRRYDEHVLRLRDGDASPPRGARRRRA